MEEDTIRANETQLGRVVEVHPRLMRRMEPKKVEMLGTGGRVIMLRYGRTYMATIVEALEAGFGPRPEKESVN